MIKHDDELRVAARLRRDVMDIVGLVRNASEGVMPYSDPSPNRGTQRRVGRVLVHLREDLIRLGTIPVTLHGSCGRPEHDRLATWKVGRSAGHWIWEFPGGRIDAECRDGRFVVFDGRPVRSDLDDAIVNQHPEKAICPCRRDASPVDHTISSGYAWPLDPDSRLGDLTAFRHDLETAYERAGGGRSRSGIREALLKLLFELERLIVEEDAGKVLSRRFPRDDGLDEPV